MNEKLPAYTELEDRLKVTEKDYDRFVQLTFQLRENQKLYFKNRSSLTLDKCKKQERELDKLIEEYGLKKKTQAQQTKIF